MKQKQNQLRLKERSLEHLKDAGLARGGARLDRDASRPENLASAESAKNGAQLSGGASGILLLLTNARLERDGAKAARDVSKASGRLDAELVRNTVQISGGASGI